MSEEAMMNATPISQLNNAPISLSTSAAHETAQQAGSYTDILKNLEIARKASPPQPQTDQLSIGTTLSQQEIFSMQSNGQKIEPTPQMLMQIPVNQNPQNNVMQQMQNQASVYNGNMPQSSPVSNFVPPDTMMSQVNNAPLKSELLPDPMFFQNPPPPRKIKKVYVEKEPERKTFMGFDQVKLKSAVLVSAIVFALISYVAPLLARSIAWTVNAETGKFTAAGLLLISSMTGGIYLGLVSIIEKFGNGIM